MQKQNYMTGDNPKKNKGFTLIEMMVAVAIFTALVAAGSSVFVASIKSQRQSLATQEVLDQTSYLVEHMSRALRMAKKDMAGTCTGTVRLNYIFEDQCIKFVNYNDECQQFCLDGTRIKNEDGVYLTSDSLQITDFSVDISGEYQPPADNLQPRVTVSLGVEGQEESGIRIQTTVSQRNLDVRR